MEGAALSARLSRAGGAPGGRPRENARSSSRPSRIPSATGRAAAAITGRANGRRRVAAAGLAARAGRRRDPRPTPDRRPTAAGKGSSSTFCDSGRGRPGRAPVETNAAARPPCRAQAPDFRRNEERHCAARHPAGPPGGRHESARGSLPSDFPAGRRMAARGRPPGSRSAGAGRRPRPAAAAHAQPKAWWPVCARPRISAWMSCVPS
jgi:hypothetical protein